ncbi:gamma-tubulin complex component 2-like isoform X1 [Neocloeon triangulifer]|uniref:gamma-tubulin complex component 2-like isoform X1 n=1 Tax=Neocloeon triangulifer TaxID=2078957 RepID=UPI00286F7F4E|nr:gamma-tubulin complex component 2-like isoform X1 [Neocloeon triangulifer]
MAEFKNLQLSAELALSLGISDQVSEDALNKAIELSNRILASSSAKQDHLNKLREQCSDQKAFSQKYFEIKEKNCDILGPYVELLSCVADDKRVKKMLKLCQQEEAALNGNGKQVINVSSEGLSQVKNKLKAITEEFERPSHDNKLSIESHGTLKRSNGITVELPSFPDWFQTHPYMTNDFACGSEKGGTPITLAKVPVASQEQAILSDLINCLSGIDGQHIVAMPLENLYAKREFRFAVGMDKSLKELALKVLELASLYSSVVRFIEQKTEFRFGRVNNALAAAMDEHIIEYLGFVAQNENQRRSGNLGLQKLVFNSESMSQLFRVLAHTAQTVNNNDARGGRVLTLLHQLTLCTAGDKNAQEICFNLIQKASKPYLESLDEWLLKGVINDPFDEFMVEDNQVETDGALSTEDCDGYWEKRYTIRKDRVPLFISEYAEKILRTGKYLNVMQQCGKRIHSPQKSRTVYTLHGSKCEEVIEEAYQYASKMLLEILLRDYDLIGRLKWMKKFFLLEQGDFISQCMDLCDETLRKPVMELEPTRLDFLFGLVLRTSNVETAYLEDLHTTLITSSLPDQIRRIICISNDTFPLEDIDSSDLEDKELSGYESFAFSADVKWPVSLVINSHDHSRYQMIFRHLFFIKYVERSLCQVWNSNKVARRFSPMESPLYRPAFSLRQRMLNFVLGLQYYMTGEVIEPNWHIFMEKMKRVNSVDDVLTYHTDFIDQCQRECMLTVLELLQPLRELLDCIMDFCKFILHVRNYFVEAELELTESFDASESSELHRVDFEDNWTSFSGEVEHHNEKFNSLLFKFLDLVGSLERDTTHARLLLRMDFNSFYSTQRKGSLSLNKSSTSSTTG